MQESQNQYETMRNATKDGVLDALKEAGKSVILWVVIIAVSIPVLAFLVTAVLSV